MAPLLPHPRVAAQLSSFAIIYDPPLRMGPSGRLTKDQVTRISVQDVSSNNEQISGNSNCVGSGCNQQLSGKDERAMAQGGLLGLAAVARLPSVVKKIFFHQYFTRNEFLNEHYFTFAASTVVVQFKSFRLLCALYSAVPIEEQQKQANIFETP